MDEQLPQLPEQPQYQEPMPKYKHFLNKKFIVTFVILALLGTGAYAGIWYWQNQQVAQEVVPTFTPRVIDEMANMDIHSDNQYGFSINLPESWKGHTVINSQWEGHDMANGKVIDHGPIITLRHPLWTTTNPREDMPVMIFTPAQWMLLQQGKMSVGAAPIPPSILGQNSKYVIALPARYNYDYKAGWEEVDQLVHSLKSFEPTAEGQFCGGIAAGHFLCPNGYTCKLVGDYPDAGGTCVKERTICAQVITRAKNLTTGEIRDFPTPCDVPAGWQKI